MGSGYVCMYVYMFVWFSQISGDLTRAREWGPELRAREGGSQNLPPPTNSAPMKARIINFFMEGRLAKYLYHVQFL